MEPFQIPSAHLPALQTHSSPPSHKMSTCHPQVAQRKQRYKLRSVFGQALVAHLGESGLAFDHSEGVFHLGSHAGLELFGLVQQACPWRALIQCPALARTHGYLPVHTGGLSSLAGSLVTCIGKHELLIPIQQAVALGEVIDVGRCSDDGVYQAGFSIKPIEPSCRNATGCPSWSGAFRGHAYRCCSWWSWARQ